MIADRVSHHRAGGGAIIIAGEDQRRHQAHDQHVGGSGQHQGDSDDDTYGGKSAGAIKQAAGQRHVADAIGQDAQSKAGKAAQQRQHCVIIVDVQRTAGAPARTGDQHQNADAQRQLRPGPAGKGHDRDQRVKEIGSDLRADRPAVAGDRLRAPSPALDHQQVGEDVGQVERDRLRPRHIDQDAGHEDQRDDQVQRPDAGGAIDQEVHVTGPPQIVHQPVIIAVGNDEAAENEEKIDRQIGAREKRDGEGLKGRRMGNMVEQDRNGGDAAQARERGNSHAACLPAGGASSKAAAMASHSGLRRREPSSGNPRDSWPSGHL